MTNRQGFIRALDGRRLHWAGWGLDTVPADQPVAIIVHGYGEHLRRYAHVAQWLVQGGLAVLAIDVRGHGQSDGDRGHVDRYDEYLVDVGAAFDLAGRLRPEGPRVLIGHSNGGLIALRYTLSESGIRPDVVVLSGPLLELAMKVPAWKEKVSAALSKAAGSLAMPNDIDAGFLSHDPQIVSAYVDDPLNHSVATARYFTEMQAAAENALVRAPQLDRPMLILHGGDDKIVSPNGSRRLADALASDENVEHIEYKGFYHEIFNEVERHRVFADIEVWLSKHNLWPGKVEDTADS